MHMRTQIRVSLWMILCLACTTVLAAQRPGQTRPASGFEFAVAPQLRGDAGAAAALREAIVAHWQAYLRMDAKGYAERYAVDAIRLSARAPARQAGRDAIAAGMALEWQAFERPEQRIAERMRVTRAEFEIEGDAATTVYWLAIEGGARWEYSDVGLVFQAWQRQDGGWQVVHQTDAWSLDYDAANGVPGEDDALHYDFAYPVLDLDRAVRFYTPLLGPPESRSATQAVFQLRGARFILDTTRWGGHARVRPGLPNGYAVFHVDDVAEPGARIAEAGELGASWPVGADTVQAGFDVDGNLFLLRETDYESGSGPAPVVAGYPQNPAAAPQAQRLMQHWMDMDSEAFAGLLAPAATWFDDTRLKHRGLERGARSITQALEDVYWPLYDQGEAGLTARLMASEVQVRRLGSRLILSHDRQLHGRGPHPFLDSAWVTLVYDTQLRVQQGFVVDNNRSRAPVLELDYTGYPVQNLDAARHFYTQALDLGEGYPDESYYGYWSSHAVFGLYEADPEEDDLPQAQRANGYMSFWVRSAREVHDYLRKQGRSFPTIPAINEVAGIDHQPGYAQVVSTDSEGNLVIFTEYSGRPR